MRQYIFYFLCVLLASICLFCFARKKAVWKARSNTKKSHNYKVEFKSNLADICVEILIVFVGAILAVILTNYSTKQYETQNLVVNLKIVHDDIAFQGIILEKINEKFNSSEEVDQLTINSNLDIALLEKILYTEPAMKFLPKATYSALLSSCRTLDRYQAAIQSIDYDKSEAIEIVDRMRKQLNYLVFEIELTLNYMDGKMSKKQFEGELTDIITIIKQENDDLMWND